MYRIYSQCYEIEEKLAAIDKSIRQIYLATQQRDITADLIPSETEYSFQHPVLKDLKIYLENLATEWTDLIRKKKFLESIEPSGYSDYPYKIPESNGYVKLYKTPDYDSYTDTRAEHRYVMEKHLKRKLESHEFVHHKDCNKHNNRLSNLQVVSHLKHARLHGKIRHDKRKKK